MEASRLGVTLLRWSWLIVLCGAIAAAVAFGISMQLPEEYESESTLLVGSLTETDPSEQLGYQQLAGTYASLAETPLVLTTVADKLGLDTDLPRLREQVDAQHAEGQALIRIVATAPTAAAAAALAESVGETLSDLSVTPGLDTVPLATVVEEATLSEGPSAPSVRLNALIAGALGVLAGVLIVIVIDGRRAAKVTPQPQGWQPHPVQPPLGPPRR